MSINETNKENQCTKIYKKFILTTIQQDKYIYLEW